MSRKPSKFRKRKREQRRKLVPFDIETTDFGTLTVRQFEGSNDIGPHDFLERIGPLPGAPKSFIVSMPIVGHLHDASHYMPTEQLMAYAHAADVGYAEGITVQHGGDVITGMCVHDETVKLERRMRVRDLFSRIIKKD